MKTKFESNVASELPKTKASQEPGLPWKVDSSELEKIASAQNTYKAMLTGEPPMKTRAIFLIMLVITVFGATLYYISAVALENENTRESIQKKEAAIVAMKADVEKIKSEKNALNENINQLDRKVRDLSAQKELFTTVIESLTKKADEPQGPQETENVTPPPAPKESQPEIKN